MAELFCRYSQKQQKSTPNQQVLLIVVYKKIDESEWRCRNTRYKIQKFFPSSGYSRQKFWDRRTGNEDETLGCKVMITERKSRKHRAGIVNPVRCQRTYYQHNLVFTARDSLCYEVSNTTTQCTGHSSNTRTGRSTATSKNAMKAYAETEIELHSFLTRTLNVSGHLHVPTTKECPVST